MHWTAEQSMGLVAPPPRVAHDVRRKRAELPVLPRLGYPYDNLMAAACGLIDAEEYLRREGVGSNGFVLSNCRASE
jgi:hypothetical protein